MADVEVLGSRVFAGFPVLAGFVISNRLEDPHIVRLARAAMMMRAPSVARRLALVDVTDLRDLHEEIRELTTLDERLGQFGTIGVPREQVLPEPTQRVTRRVRVPIPTLAITSVAALLLAAVLVDPYVPVWVGGILGALIFLDTLVLIAVDRRTRVSHAA